MAEECELLSLPAELRNDIYRLVVIQPNPIRILVPKEGFDLRVRPSLQPPILEVSQQIRTEALAVHYGENVFEFEMRPSDIMHCRNQGAFAAEVTGRFKKTPAALRSAEDVASCSLQPSQPLPHDNWQNAIECCIDAVIQQEQPANNELHCTVNYQTLATARQRLESLVTKSGPGATFDADTMTALLLAFFAYYTNCL